MAQWMWQFTGKTHKTKISDVEDLLRHAVTVYHGDKSDKTAMSVLNLAERLLTARLKLLKTKIVDLEPFTEVARDRRKRRMESLQQQQAELKDNGVNGILTEFGVSDLIND